MLHSTSTSGNRLNWWTCTVHHWWKKIHRWWMTSKNVSGETAVILLWLNFKNKLKRDFKKVLDPQLLKNVNFLLFWRSKPLVKSGNVEMSTCFDATSIARKGKFQSSNFLSDDLVRHLVEKYGKWKVTTFRGDTCIYFEKMCQNTFCKSMFMHCKKWCWMVFGIPLHARRVQLSSLPLFQKSDFRSQKVPIEVTFCQHSA